LFPETSLLNYLIEELERAARPDDGLRPGEQSLKDQLKAVAELMNSDLADVNAWRQIGDVLRGRQSQNYVAYTQQTRKAGPNPRQT
jgi:hypothetical protein